MWTTKLDPPDAYTGTAVIAIKQHTLAIQKIMRTIRLRGSDGSDHEPTDLRVPDALIHYIMSSQTAMFLPEARHECQI